MESRKACEDQVQNVKICLPIYMCICVYTPIDRYICVCVYTHIYIYMGVARRRPHGEQKFSRRAGARFIRRTLHADRGGAWRLC